VLLLLLDELDWLDSEILDEDELLELWLDRLLVLRLDAELSLISSTPTMRRSWAAGDPWRLALAL